MTVDDLTAVVLELFRRCFSRDDIAPDDDFFALGGDSLLASRLLARVYEVCQADLRPDAIFRHPTPRALAQSISWRARDADVDRTPSLVPLNRGGRGAPIYLVHPTSGNPWVFRPLVERARFGRPVFGTRAPDLDWRLDVMSMAEMAQHYTLEIRRLQPRGPYSLAGYSFGGNLAFDIANRLAADGGEVAHLVMFDTPGPYGFWERHTAIDRHLTIVRRALCRMGRAGAALLDAMGFTSPGRRAFLCFDTGPMTTRELRRVVRISFPEYARRHDVRRASMEELCAILLRQARPTDTAAAWEYLIRRAPGDDAATLVKAHKVWAKNQWLGMQHRPSIVFPGTITIYACRDNRAVERWQRLSARPLDIRRIPVGRDGHTSLLEEGYVGTFADDVKHLLEGTPGPAVAFRRD